MKIIEALKKLKLIEKKMASNIENIAMYSSTVSTERPFFGTEDAQRKEVDKLIQSNTDLVKEYLRTKEMVEYTNLKIKVPFRGNQEYSLSELLALKRKVGDALINTYQALSTRYADQRMARAPKDLEGKPAQVARLYDEGRKNEALLDLMTFMSDIESRLEVINATTDLIEDEV